MTVTRAAIEEMISKPLAKAQIELVDIQYRQENGEKYLRVFIDHENGVDLDLCTRASRLLKPLLDQEEIYYDHLEVSSPGLDRIIKRERDLERFTGEKIKVKMLKQFDGPAKIAGILTGFSDTAIVLETEDKSVQLPRDMISIIRLNPDL
ncbi:ribosome maturation factor RimP [Syntrophomonas palmitatica]|uniref:ribosome maturation factor RimP n=1 Tax=Syntrophomonas palmitatica TaxID=402877 RepID=UPI0006D1B8F6|nr:ribosome maturation factor RimP [Syntrophomonas palmitatica]